MKNRMTLCVGLVGLLLASCGANDASPSSAPPAESSAATVNAPTSSTASTTAAPATSVAATTTVAPGPPVYDPQRIGNALDLASFVFTITVDNTNSGQLSQNITSIGYTKEPSSMYRLATFSFDGTGGGERSYLVGDRSYDESQFGDWNLFEAGSRATPEPSDSSELGSSVLAGVLTAQLVGQEDFGGLPANHFVFNETNTRSFASYTPENPSPTVEGDFYLAQEGNYVLYAHSKETSPGRIYEVTEAMSFIGQLGEITLPDDMAPMSQALDVGLGLLSVLPPGSALSGMLRYGNGIGVDYYTYVAAVGNNGEFINFYRTMPPTAGWTVAHIGHITPHLEPTNCETRNECVILQNGGDQVVVSFAGTITLEYDREHIFAPV